ncbi:MAG: hypothetical protein J7M25_05435 [Deltaproteobacteria bacterium]|nr:hypothetical protein [Deltaproteobacteria bacterium]
MKKVLAAMTLALALGAGTYQAKADGCYLCEGGGYARYRGSDTFAKRKAALKKCKCKVTGTTSSCSNPKCTVTVMGLNMNPLLSRLNRIGLDLDSCS